jgi:outer membrane protein, adhesin transport system
MTLLKPKTLSLILLLVSQAAGAQVIYGLKDCIGIGLERNFSILVAKNSQTISDNNYTIGNAGYLPTIGVSGRYGGSMTNTTQNMDDGTRAVTNGTTASSLTGSVNLSMTIFNGFNVVTTYKKLGELKQIGELNTQLTLENYISSVVTVYYTYIQQVQKYNNLVYALSLSRERLRIDEVRYLNGASSRLNLLQSRVYLNSDSSNLAKQILVLRENQIRLNELMAVDDIGARFSLRDTTVDVVKDLLYEKLLEETLKLNTSLQIAAKNKIVTEYDYRLVASRVYPYLNLNGAYNYALSASSTASYKNQMTDGPNFGLTFGVNIFDGLDLRRQLKNSQLEIKNKELKYMEVEQGVRADLLAIYSAYINNLNLITLEEQNVATATENLDIALERYRLGNLSGIDLREVQKSLLDARDRLLSVRYIAKLAEISLFQISGRIMDYYQ